MAEAAPVRRLLVELLAEIPGKQATAALAQRAVFDLSPEVRRAAAAAALREKDAALVQDLTPLVMEDLTVAAGARRALKGLAARKPDAVVEKPGRAD